MKTKTHPSIATSSFPPEAAEEKAFCEAYDITKYPQPSIATDIVALTLREMPTENYRNPTEIHASLLLIRRGGHPFRGSWALPGGFLQSTESVEECARRELEEETGLRARALLPVGVYSAPGRDPRGWIVSSAFLLAVPKNANSLRAGDDAKDARWCDFSFSLQGERAILRVATGDGPIEEHLDVQRTPYGEIAFRVAADTLADRDGAWNRKEHLAFDHAAIVANALHRLRTEETLARSFAFAFLPETFTLQDLREVFEMMGGERLSIPNFRRKLQPYLEETGLRQHGVGHRPAQLFRRKLS